MKTSITLLLAISLVNLNELKMNEPINFISEEEVHLENIDHVKVEFERMNISEEEYNNSVLNALE